MPATKIATGAAVLAGGRSKRMGTNKALLRLKPGGPTLIELVVERLREAGLGKDLLLVTDTPAEYRFLGLPALPDDVPGAGPLGGILTALTHTPYARTLVVACDMPLLSPTLIRYMAQLPDAGDVLIPRWSDEKGMHRLETLHAIYSRRCIEPIRARIERDDLQANRLLEDVSVRYIDEEELRRFDPRLLSFRNINTPDELSGLQ